MDAQGALVARLQGLQAKRTSAERLRQMVLATPAGMYQMAWRPSRLRIATENAASRKGEQWLLLESGQGDCALVANQLQQQGATCQVVSSAAFDPSDLTRRPWTGILYDARTSDDAADASSWTHPERPGVEFLLQFVRSLQTSTVSVPRLWIVTSSAVGVSPLQDVSISQSPLWGLARSLMLEHPEVAPVLLDVGSAAGTVAAASEIAQSVADEIAAGGLEPMVAFRYGNRRVARLVADIPRVETAQKLQFDPSGRLEDLRVEPSSRTEPAANEVEIQVRASGLNFRDVLTALGMLPARSNTPGAECSGTIVRVGAGSA